MKNLLIVIFSIISLQATAQLNDSIEFRKDELIGIKSNAIKMEFFSPLTGNFTVGYEKYIANGISWEGNVGIIGVGTNIENQKGIFFKIGPKAKLTPDYIINGLKSSHPLRGSYLKPAIAISHFSKENVFDYLGEEFETTNTSMAILLNFGKQYILVDRFTVDWNIGVGYGFSSDDDWGYKYGMTIAGSGFPIAFSSGFSVGLLL